MQRFASNFMHNPNATDSLYLVYSFMQALGKPAPDPFMSMTTETMNVSQVIFRLCIKMTKYQNDLPYSSTLDMTLCCVQVQNATLTGDGEKR